MSGSARFLSWHPYRGSNKKATKAGLRPSMPSWLGIAQVSLDPGFPPGGEFFRPLARKHTSSDCCGQPELQVQVEQSCLKTLKADQAFCFPVSGLAGQKRMMV
jgi:hypothetical protein